MTRVFKRRWVKILGVLLLFGGVVYAGTVVDQGLAGRTPWPVTIMSATQTNYPVGVPVGATLVNCALTNSNSTTLIAVNDTTCPVTPAGVSYYITHVEVSGTKVSTAAADQQYIFKEGSGTNCASNTATLAIGGFADTLGGFEKGDGSAVLVKLTPARQPCVLNAATGNMTVHITAWVK